MDYAKVVNDAMQERKSRDEEYNRRKIFAINTFLVAVTNNKGEFAEAFAFLDGKKLIYNLKERESLYKVLSDEGTNFEVKGPVFEFQYTTERAGSVAFWGNDNGRGFILTYDNTVSNPNKRQYPLTEKGFEMFVRNELF
jgi:hypothetical protein